MSSAFTATDGAGYEQLMGRWSVRLAEPFLDFCGTIDGERVLDVGSGTGNLSLAIVKRSKPQAVLGVDFSPAYVAFARSKTDNPVVRFEQGDATKLALEDKSFDRVLSMLVLHHVPSAPKAIAEMRRVAKPGATVAACVWDSIGGFPSFRLFFDTAALLDTSAKDQRNRMMTRPLSRPGELLAAFRLAGLADCEERSLTIRMDFASFADYWSPYLGGQGPGGDYVAKLTPDKLRQLEEAVKEAFLVGEPDGPRSFTATVWAVKGRAPG